MRSGSAPGLVIILWQETGSRSRRNKIQFKILFRVQNLQLAHLSLVDAFDPNSSKKAKQANNCKHEFLNRQQF